MIGFARIILSLLTIIFVLNGTVEAQRFPTFINGAFSFGNAGGSPYALADTFLLESNPTATKTIYLDFNGHHSVNNGWGHNIVFDAFDRDGDVNSFSNAELIEIQKQFQNVAEDFLPFNVNVTTRDFGAARLIKSNAADQFYGMRALNTQYKNGFGNGTGGIAFLNSFGSSDDTPVFSFNKGENNGAMTNSHEVGHALGLRHDGLNASTYHPGTGGTAATSWGPIMGAPFNTNVTQWNNGDYLGANQFEDDLAVITKPANGFGFRLDDHGNTTASATNLAAGPSISSWGVVEQRTDLDFFAFDFLTAGDLSLLINPFQGRPNLDILANFYDSNGVLLFSSNPVDDVNAMFNLQITTAGRYYLSIDGTGKTGVYSDYGSLGFFTVEGSFLSSVPEPTTGVLLVGLVLAGALRRTRKSNRSLA
ncbi:MAG: zinc-dependent metalloprotease family protein [Pirellulaceae bacterium]